MFLLIETRLFWREQGVLRVVKLYSKTLKSQKFKLTKVEMISLHKSADNSLSFISYFCSLWNHLTLKRFFHYLVQNYPQ